MSFATTITITTEEHHMAVNVYLHDGAETRHESGTKWTVDDHGYLHVIGNGATVATYATGCWQWATSDETFAERVRLELAGLSRP